MHLSSVTNFNLRDIALQQYYSDGLDILCADGFTRKCYPTIAGFMADYEEQVVITGIKNGKHCSMCQVPPDCRENLRDKWPYRTHKDTIEQLKTQTLRGEVHLEPDIEQSDRESDRGASDDENANVTDANHESSTQIPIAINPKDMDVHMIRNFAWSHDRLNIHRSQFVDILHQLLKGVVTRALEWCIDVATEVTPGIVCQAHVASPTSKSKKRKRKTVKKGWEVQVDERFRSVPPFPGLKRFPRFSKVTQWTGDEHKAMARQLVPVFTPFLVDRAPAALLCLRAMMDFIRLAMYNSHTDESLGYLRAALNNIDRLKHVFIKSRPLNRRTKRRHFNFPKFHVMVHYVEAIRYFGSAVGVDSSYGESAHKFTIKDFYGRTNRNFDFNEQILLHNIRRQNILAMNDVLLYARSRSTTSADIEETLQVNSVSEDPTKLHA